MSWLRLALANLLMSPLTSAVNVLLMSLGTASIVLLLLAGHQLSETMSRDAKGIDLVIGAKGSPVQLVLSSVYHADIPTGNIRLADAQQWIDDPRVAQAVPLSLGDSYRGFRIVGTTTDYSQLYDGSISSGRWWNRPMETVVGAQVAEASGVALQSRFAGAHGLTTGGHSHDQKLYQVVGVLEPTGTVIDRLIFTSLESVWDIHDHRGSSAISSEKLTRTSTEPPQQQADHKNHQDLNDHDDHKGHGDHGDEIHDQGHEDDEGGAEQGSYKQHESIADREITALLIVYQSPMAAVSLPRQINASGSLQAAAPALEISRLLQLVGIGLDGLKAFAVVLVAVAALSVFAALYGSLSSRRGDLAMLRCLGATRWELLQAILLEGFLLSLAGVTLGYLIGHSVMELLAHWLQTSRGVSLTGWTWVPGETLLLIGLFGVSVISAIIPAVQAYRTDVARTLALET